MSNIIIYKKIKVIHLYFNLFKLLSIRLLTVAVVFKLYVNLSQIKAIIIIIIINVKIICEEDLFNII